MIEAEGFSSYLEALRERIINNPNDGKAAYPESIRLQNNLTKEK